MRQHLATDSPSILCLQIHLARPGILVLAASDLLASYVKYIIDPCKNPSLALGLITGVP